MKRLLLVTYTFPPFLTPESLLVTRTVRALSKLGWEITVLTVNEADCLDSVDYELMQLVPPSVRIVRAPSFERSLTSRKSIWNIVTHRLPVLGWPETQLFWYFGAVVKGLQLIREKRFDVLHSWASYHTSNVVGLTLKQITRLPWVSHFSDPWVDNSYTQDSLTSRQSHVISRLERAVVHKSDAVVLTTTQTVDLMMGKYPRAWRDKVSVIPHGYDTQILGLLPSGSTSSSSLRLVYTGNLYGRRSSQSFLRALEILANRDGAAAEIEVQFFGHVTSEDRELAQELGLENIVFFHDQIPYVKSLQVAAGADVLLLIDAPSSNPSPFLPSKLVDYLMLKKPILGLTPRKGASADLLRELECPVVAPDDVPGIADALRTLWSSWRSNGLLTSPKYDDVAARYDMCVTGPLLDRLLIDVVNA